MGAARGHVTLVRPGRVPYGQALTAQLDARAQLQQRSFDGDDPELGVVFALEHGLTVTLGRRGKIEHLTAPALLHARGAEVFLVDRGGEATLHEPGQLVVYPVLALGQFPFGVVDLIRGMARAIAEILGEDYGVSAAYDEDHPGVWVELPGGGAPRKIASVGMRVSGGVTTHGVAVNLINDLTGFMLIVPCGMPSAPMTRLLDLVSPALAADPRALFEAFTARFLARLEALLGAPLRDGEASLPADRARWAAALDY